MSSSFTPQLKKLLLSHGCRFKRQGKGDHEIWFSPITQRRFVVDGDIKSRHTANTVLGSESSSLVYEVGATPNGVRRIRNLQGGTFSGPKLRGDGGDPGRLRRPLSLLLGGERPSASGRRRGRWRSPAPSRLRSLWGA